VGETKAVTLYCDMIARNNSNKREINWEGYRETLVVSLIKH